MRGTTSMSRKAAGVLTATLAAALLTCAPTAHAATVSVPPESESTSASSAAADRPEQDSGVPLAPLGLLIAGFTIVGVSRFRARGQAPIA